MNVSPSSNQHYFKYLQWGNPDSMHRICLNGAAHRLHNTITHLNAQLSNYETSINIDGLDKYKWSIGKGVYCLQMFTCFWYTCSSWRVKKMPSCQWNKQNVWFQNWLYIKNIAINNKGINKIILKIRTFWIIKQKMLLLFSAKETDSSSTKLRHTVARSENWLREKSKGRISKF